MPNTCAEFKPASKQQSSPKNRSLPSKNRHQSISPGPSLSSVETDWKPTRDHVSSAERSCPVQVQEAINQELVDLLRSQITKLLEENEKILTTMDDYREQIASLKREQTESAPDLTVEQMALQTELGESRLREAELTIAFSELQERITAIDRMIETDPEMERFFNAVTISTTAMSRQKPSQRTSHATSPTVRDKRSNTTVRAPESHELNNPTKHGKTSHRREGIKQATSPERYDNRSGLESPQSDSGCSLNSHMTSEANDLQATEDREMRRKQYTMSRLHTPKHLSQEDTEFDEEFSEDRMFKNDKPLGLSSMLRRSRSSATDHQYSFKVDQHSSLFPWDRADTYTRHADDTPTPTEVTPHSESFDESDGRSVDRFSKLRASFRKSFGFGLGKPDFRMEAFAARQGEARALLSLRETRMELLRVQSRCQTLQRHVDRLEAVNASRMEELEASMACDRELRQEIRGLQKRIFELEAEHREYKVNQRIKEMELLSKLAEANMQLSHVELTNQQAVILSELNKVHEDATNLLTPTTPKVERTHQHRNDRKETTRTMTITRENAPPSHVKRRPTLDHSITRMSGSRCNENSKNHHAEYDPNSCCNDLSKTSGYPSSEADEFLMERSCGSLSEFRLQPDPTLLED